MAFSLRRSLAWMSVSQAGLAAMQFGASLVIARLLTPYETGVFAVAAALAGVLGMLRSVGLSNYIIRAPALDRAFLSGVFTVNVILSGLVALLIGAVSLLGGRLLGEPGVRDVLLALALVPLLATLELLPSACIERAGNFRAISMVNLGRNLVATAVMLAAAFAGHSYMSLAYGQVAGGLVGVTAMNLVGRRHASLRLGLHGWRDVTRYGLDMLATAGVVQFYVRMSDFILGWILGLHALGLYARAAGLLTVIWENFQIVILRVVYVDLVAQQRQGMSFRASYLRVLSLATGVLWPAFGGLAVVAGPTLLLLYGPQWTGGAPVLSLLCLAAIPGSGILMVWEMFLATGQTRRLVRLQAVQCCFGLTAFTLGCLGGIAGAAAARTVEACFNLALFQPHIARLADVRLSDVVPVVRQGLLLLLLAVAPAAALMGWHGWSPATPMPQVAGAIAAGVAGWAAGLWLLDHPLWQELRRLANRTAQRPAVGPAP